MIKEAARKKSTDPVQEQLRQHKDKWNHDVSEFIEAIKQYKKMVNGFPSKFHMEKSKIQDPLPDSAANVINSLTDSFKNIALDSNKIVSEQLSYSKTRKKKLPKQITSPLESPSTDLSAQLSKANEEYILISEASNALTRFLSGIKRPWFGKSPARREKLYRLSMLKILVKLDKKLALLEAEIMGKSPESIYKVIQIFDSLEIDVSKLEHNLHIYIAGLKEEKALPQIATTPVNEEVINKSPETNNDVVSKPEPTTTIKPKLDTVVDVVPSDTKVSPFAGPLDIESAAFMIRDFERNRLEITKFDPDIYSEMMKLRRVFLNTQSKSQLDATFINQVSSTYNALLSALKQKEGIEANTIEEAKNLIRNKKKADVNSVDKMNKFAERSVKKWIGQLKHWFSSDETTASRKDILNIVEKCRDQVGLLLDYLEDDFDPKYLKEQFVSLSADVSSMGEIIDGLSKTIKALRFDKPFIDLLEQKKILDHKPNMSDKEKEMVMRQLERERVRELSKMYGGKK